MQSIGFKSCSSPQSYAWGGNGGKAHDDISLLVRRDTLILELGKSLLMKVGAEKREYISQRLRQLGRLVLTLTKLDGEGEYLMDFLKPDKFDLVINGVKQISMMTTVAEDRTCGIPSLSLKLGYSLKKCVLILQGFALRQRDSQQLETAKLYLKLHESEWAEKISSHALSTMASRKFNKGDVLPVTTDLVNLRKFLLAEMNERGKALNQAPSPQTWTSLVEATLSRLILFNKKRGGGGGSTYASQELREETCLEKFCESRNNAILDYSGTETQ